MSETKPLLMCKIDTEYLADWVEEVEDNKNYYIILFKTEVKFEYRYDVVFIQDKKMIKVHDGKVGYDMVLEMMPYMSNFKDWVETESELFKCNEGEPVSFGKVKHYQKPIMEFIYNETEEGVYVIRVYKTINSKSPYILQGVFLPLKGKETDNHCAKGGQLENHGGMFIGLCSLTESTAEKLIDKYLEDVDEENDIINFF